MERELKRQYRERRSSFIMLINHSHPGKDILHVGSSQRFWLRPALKELEDMKYIKLLRVDWNETFSPPWLPIVYRGRKEIRAADYTTYNARYVINYINDYVEHRLPEFVWECAAKLREVKETAFKQSEDIPDIKNFTAMVMADIKPQEKQG